MQDELLRLLINDKVSDECVKKFQARKGLFGT